MSTDDPRKIFLSHKSSDKDLVLDFKETLDLLGYETWLDEDDMPAGTTLERGLLRGMRESRAVVFFITSSFEDEGYLETEINYAIQEKRDKGGEFSIIILLLKGDDDETAPIPDLLSPYVWKTPRTHLEALREIIRALPATPANSESQDDVATVDTGPEMPSQAVELSDEAKTILREAASGGGKVRHFRFLGGQTVQVRGKSLIPDENPRTVARWLGGIEDLRQLRYVKSLGRGKTGELFEVTREGYGVADEI